ncbi:MAG TPA: hypothetical protein VKB80_33340, partial [Kofleriaceae bacterium]|nr:hypothetical protein [Kofleriaceae bacterium]
MTNRSHVLFLAALAAAPAPAGCKPKEVSRSGGDKIAVGATLPLTGAEARIGGFFKEGYELAFEEVKAKGGLKVGDRTLPVSLSLLDD